MNLSAGKPLTGFIIFAAFLLVSCHHRPAGIRSTAETDRHHSSYDDSTLTRAQIPLLLPYNRIIDPAGKMVSWGDPQLENHSLAVKLVPGTPYLLVLDRFGVSLIDKGQHKLADEWFYSSNATFKGMMSVYSGLCLEQLNGKTTFYFSAAGGKKRLSYVIQAAIENGKIVYKDKIPFEAESPSPLALPNGLALHDEDGKHYLYIVLNGNNRLVKYNLNTRSVIYSRPTGVAPYTLTIAGTHIFVTNWGGPDPEDSSNMLHGKSLETAGVPYGKTYIDAKTGATLSGTVTVFEESNGNKLHEVEVGLHPNDIIHSADEKTVYVSNSNSDNISVLDAVSGRVIQTIPVMLLPGRDGFLGDSPNALTLNASGDRLYVANGLDNAVAVVALQTAGPARLLGFFPTGAYPASMVLSSDTLIVANLEGIGARVDSRSLETSLKAAGGGSANLKTEEETPLETTAFNAHHQLATVSFIPVPADDALAASSRKVEALNLLFRAELARLKPRVNARPRPLPDRIGEPSVFKHVIYVIKENRTYDQVFGDIPTGNGRADLCIFGNAVTPNQHVLSKDFFLMDNYYVSGKSSAEGHQWTDEGLVTDYVEKSVRAWFRSYPHVQEDALVYHRNGFIWNDAADHGRTVRIYGEACKLQVKKGTTWANFYEAYKTGQKIPFTNTSTISRVRPMLSDTYPSGDSHESPDVVRAQAFNEDLNRYNKEKGDHLPNLMVLALSSDHTAGASPGLPTPRAMVADNDLALGRIIEALSKTKFWKNTVVFVTEDDSQSGWDHVSAYRTTGLVISPYSHLQKTVHTNYNQTCMLRSIEQILGIPPMTTIDATASPMFNCFTERGDFRPFKAVLNQTRLDEMNPGLAKLKGKDLFYAKASMLPEFIHLDGGRDDLLNRIIWNSAKTGRPYPARLTGPKDE